MTADRRPIVLTRAQVRRVDRIALDRYGVPGIVLMENASRGVASAVRRDYPSIRTVLVLCGGGNNGGDGLAVARHLHNAGASVAVGLCADPARYAGDALVNWRIVEAMNLPTHQVTPEWLDEGFWRDGWFAGPDLIVDAIFGTGLTAPPRDPFGRIVEAVESAGVPVVAVDLPSGLDCDAGRPVGERAVRADLTVTFVAVKAGFRVPGAQRYTGRVEVVDIGCPREVVEEALGGD